MEECLQLVDVVPTMRSVAYRQILSRAGVGIPSYRRPRVSKSANGEIEDKELKDFK